MSEPKCPKCGYVMCQQFDEEPATPLASVLIPNGTYICYHCHTTKQAEEPKREFTGFTCGPQCIDGKDEHQWDGPIVKLEKGGTASCSKCGKLAIEVSLWMDDGLEPRL